MFGWKRGSRGAWRQVGQRRELAAQRHGDGPSAQSRGDSTGLRWAQRRGHVAAGGCHLKELPLSRPPVSGNQMPGGLTSFFFFFSCLFYFVLKQQGLAKANGSFQFWSRVRRWDGPHMHASQTDFSQFVFLTHWKPHSSEKIHLTCWGLLSRNVSSDCCVNTATLSEPPSQRDGAICQEKNTTQTLRGGVSCRVQREGGFPTGQGASPITHLSLTPPKATAALP